MGVKMQLLDKQITERVKNMPEEMLKNQATEVEKSIKIALIRQNMTQRQLAEFIGEGPQQVSRAVHGGVDPKSRRIRQKIYKVLGMEESE